MARRHGHRLLQWSFTATIVLALGLEVAATCGEGQVFSLPVTNVTLDTKTYMRGIPMSVGTPPQNLSLLPEGYLNDTWVYNSTAYYCDSSWTSPLGCFTNRGGLYNPALSSTCINSSTVEAAGGDPSDTQRIINVHIWFNAWVNDNIKFGSIGLPKFPLGMPGFPIFDTYDTQGQIGLGINSTLLSTLKATGAIAARAYSWYWGMQGDTAAAQSDGQFVLGGYDAAKVQGDNLTVPIGIPTLFCPSAMVVTVTEMTLTFPNGTKAPLLGAQQLSTCVLPDHPLIMTIPTDPSYNQFESITNTQSIGLVGGNGLAFEGMGYSPNNVFGGSMTIQINNALEVEFPNDLLVVSPQNVMTDGSIQANHSVRELLIGKVDGTLGAGAALIGKHFFQAAYLNVDHDAGVFTLWSANTSSTETNLVSNAVCPSNTTNSTLPATTSPGVSNKPTSPSTATPQAAPISTAAVAGAAVGGICTALILAGIAFYFYRRRNKRRAAAAAASIEAKRRDPGTPPRPPSKFYPAQYPGMAVEVMSEPINELYAGAEPGELEAKKFHPGWHEMAATHRRYELGARYTRHEMAARNTKHWLPTSPVELEG